VVHIIAIRDGLTKEAHWCCAECARHVCQTDPLVSWWEVFDMRGNMLDSADQAIEDGLHNPCEHYPEIQWDGETGVPDFSDN
jgi:hypothetical protein